MDFATRQHMRRELRAQLEPTIERLGYELAAVELTSDRRGPVVQLFIDSEHGVGIGDCARVNHALSPELDVADPLPGKYTLEVSSPGIERSVQRDVDFERFRGLRAKVRLAPGTGRRRYTGILDGLDEEHLHLRIGDSVTLLSRDSLDKVRLDLDLEQFQQLGDGTLAPRATPSALPPRSGGGSDSKE